MKTFLLELGRFVGFSMLIAMITLIAYSGELLELIGSSRANQYGSVDSTWEVAVIAAIYAIITAIYLAWDNEVARNLYIKSHSVFAISLWSIWGLYNWLC